MDMVTRNWLILAGVVAAVYFWVKAHPENFAALVGAPYDGPDDSTTIIPAGSALVGTAAPTTATSAVAAAQAADAAWQKGAQQINPYATNFVDSRAMDGVGIASNEGYSVKNMTWDVRGSIPIARNPSAFPFGLSSRMPPPPLNNKVFCGDDQTAKWGTS